MSSGSEAGAYASCGLGTGPGGGWHSSWMPRKWLHLRKGMPPSRRDTLLKECLEAEAETEQGKMFFYICNSLILNKGLIYINTTPKGEKEGVLAFVIPMAQRCMALNGVHQDAGHQGQQWTLALAQERFWWPMMVEDC